MQPKAVEKLQASDVVDKTQPKKRHKETVISSSAKKVKSNKKAAEAKNLEPPKEKSPDSNYLISKNDELVDTVKPLQKEDIPRKQNLRKKGKKLSA
eukprot:m.68973 g.68973  ORF g.68973 m.68973 type:complete len:96 (+) comp35576_c0_seq3:919-1206(+)